MNTRTNEPQGVTCWLASAQRTPLALTLAVGAGPVLLPGGEAPQAYATLEQLRSGAKPGTLMRASALVTVEGAAETLFLLVTDHEGEEPGAWRFPCAYLLPKELPLEGAQRALAQQFTLSFGGPEVPWSTLGIRLDGELVTALSPFEMREFRARSAFVANTLEFYYPMKMVIVDPHKVHVSDRQGRERQARLFTPAELYRLSQSPNMSAAARAIWAHAIEGRALG